MTSGSSTGGAGIHANPHRTFLQTITPRRLKELFLWTEYLFYNSAHVYAALRKFGEYPITEVTYSTTNKSLRKKHKHLLENVIRVRELLIMTTLDKYVYGNAFMSMYQPFIRYLKCDRCSTLTNIQHARGTCTAKPFISRVNTGYTSKERHGNTTWSPGSTVKKV